MLKYLAGPIIGALIGYCTNFIAVKMLFYPKKEVRVFGHRLPFTPGAIPKGKGRLAKAIGTAVGTTLLTKEDIESKLKSKEVTSELTGMMMQALEQPIKGEVMKVAQISEEVYADKKSVLSDKISSMAVDVLSGINLSQILAEKGATVVKETVKGTMLEMFLSDELIASVIRPIGEELQNMVAEHGAEYITPAVNEKLNELEDGSVLQVLESMDITRDAVQTLLESVCESLISGAVDKIFDTLDIQSMVEEKVNAMSVDAVEDLVFTVMKKELNTIVNLGALIGLLLGVLNIFL